MFIIPVEWKSREDAITLVDVDCTTINSESKAILNQLNKKETVYIAAPAGIETAEKYAYELMELHFKRKIMSNLPPLRSKLQRTGVFNHERIDIHKISIAPLLLNGTQFSTQKGTYVIEESQNRLVGNISTPYYNIKDIKTGKIIRGQSQLNILKYAPMNMFQANIRKVASVAIGNGAFQSNWSVSLNKKNDRLYCSSPSHEGYKWEKCIDMFDNDCMSFVESAIVRLVIAITGLTSMLDSGRGYDNADRSCMNCQARRYIRISDTTEGDAVGPDFGSKSTFDLRTQGYCDPSLICGFDMEPCAAEEIKKVNREDFRGYNTSGHVAMDSEKFRTCAINCDKYHDEKYTYIRNNCHDVIYERGVYMVETAGIQLVFDTGITEDKPTKKPTPPAQKQSGITISNQNIVDANEDIIVHQVNCKGVMGSGVAKAIRKKWPEVYQSYTNIISSVKPEESSKLLGTVQCVEIGNGRTVVNLFAQDKYGYGKQFTDEEAFETGIKQIAELFKDKSIAMPYNIGCGRGGANWDTILPLILKYLPQTVFYSLDEKNPPNLPTTSTESPQQSKTLQCDSKGDKRFSAFYARIKVAGVEKSIEEHYQLAKRFPEIPSSIREAKGKKPTHIEVAGKQLSAEMLTPYYKFLWLRYLDSNPKLANYAKQFDTFVDIFRGKAINCQADAIEQYVKDRHGMVMEIRDFLLSFNISMPEYTAFVTGHRLGNKLGGSYQQDNEYTRAIELELEKEVRYLYTKGYRWFITGMAHGVDLVYGKVIAKLKEELKDIKLECAIPCKEHTAKWGHMTDVLAFYNDILSKADRKTLVVNKTFDEDRSCMQKRNEYMADRSSYCTAIWDGSKGGTGNAVAYVKKIPNYLVTVIDPNQLMEVV